MTEPAPAARSMTVRTAPKASPLLEALVVTLHDGRPGFTARVGEVRQVDGATLHLSAADDTTASIVGIAHVLRSGTAYEETRGRTRAALPRWRRHTLRSTDTVVVITPQT